MALDPRVLRGERLIEARYRAIVEREPLGICDRCVQHLRRDELEHTDGIMCGQSPKWIVEITENLPCVAVPCPPEVVRQLPQARHSFGQLNHDVLKRES